MNFEQSTFHSNTDRSTIRISPLERNCSEKEWGRITKLVKQSEKKLINWRKVVEKAEEIVHRLVDVDMSYKIQIQF